MNERASHYDVLGLTPECSREEVKAAFYRLLPKYPPEQRPKEYQRLREVYDTLSNPLSRKEYDALGEYSAEINELKIAAQDILFSDDPDYMQVERLLKKAIVLGPEIGILRHLLGQCYLADEEPERALVQLEKAVKIDPMNSQYLLTRARAFADVGDSESAERLQRLVWRRDPEDYRAPRDLAKVMSDDGRVDDALAILDEAIGADGQVDFKDFFCLYDKLHYLLLSGRHDELRRELDTIVSIANNPEDRRFAAFMLSHTGALLFDASAYTLAREFVSAARLLDPENEGLESFADTVEDASEIESDFKALAESSDYHDVAKALIYSRTSRYLGWVDEDEYSDQLKQVLDVLDNAMAADPDAGEIKRSIRRLRDSFPSIYAIGESIYELVLSHPVATSIRAPCPSCDKPIVAPKASVGLGSCPHCGQAILFNGTSHSLPAKSQPSGRENDHGADLLPWLAIGFLVLVILAGAC